MVYTLRFFPLQNAVCFIILTYLVPVLFKFYVQGVLKLKKNNSGAKRLNWLTSRHHYTNRTYFLLAWNQKNIYIRHRPEEAFKNGSNRRSKQLFATRPLYLCCGFLKIISVSTEFAACVLVTELVLCWNNTKVIDQNLVFQLFNIQYKPCCAAYMVIKLIRCFEENWVQHEVRHQN